MRRRQLKALWKRLGQLQKMKLKSRELLLKLGEAKGRYRAAWRLVDIQLPEPTAEGIATLSFSLNRQKLRQVRRREGRYLLRTNLCGRDPAQLWQFYIQLVEIEGRLGAAPHLSSTRASDRSAHLCGLHGLLSAGNLAGPATPTRPRPDARGCLGQFATIQMRQWEHSCSRGPSLRHI